MSYSTQPFSVALQGGQFKFAFLDGRVFYANKAEISFALQTGTSFVEVEDSTGIHTVNYLLCTSPVGATFPLWVDAVLALTDPVPLGTVNATPALPADYGGALRKRTIISQASINSTVVKAATGGRVYGWNLSNTHTTDWAYFKLHRTPISTTTMEVLVPIPPGGSVDFYTNIGLGFGATGSTGYGYTITALPDAADNTPVAADQVVGTVFYI